MIKSQESYDIASLIVNNKAAIVRDISPQIQEHVFRASKAEDEAASAKYEAEFISLVTNGVAKAISESVPSLPIDQIFAIVDIDFLTSISGDYFFDLEKYDYSRQN